MTEPGQSTRSISGGGNVFECYLTPTLRPGGSVARISNSLRTGVDVIVRRPGCDKNDRWGEACAPPHHGGRGRLQPRFGGSLRLLPEAISGCEIVGFHDEYPRVFAVARSEVRLDDVDGVPQLHGAGRPGESV